MGSMREIRTRMKSVQDTMKITNAMYLISSSKLKKARNRLEATAPYFNKLQETISDILVHSPDIRNEMFIHGNDQIPEGEKKRGYIVITSDKGLAGAYNHNVIKLVEENLKKGKDNTMFFVGLFARGYFAKHDDVKISPEFIFPASDPTILRAITIAQYVIDKFINKELDEVYLVYTKMVTAMSQEAQIIPVLPLTRYMFNQENTEEKEFMQQAVFSPSPETVLKQLVPNYVKGLIYGAMVEAFACEQSARMSAMDNATTNAKDMIRELSLLYNRVRQAAITQEITEVVSGAQSS